MVWLANEAPWPLWCWPGPRRHHQRQVITEPVFLSLSPPVSYIHAYIHPYVFVLYSRARVRGYLSSTIQNTASEFLRRRGGGVCIRRWSRHGTRRIIGSLDCWIVGLLDRWIVGSWFDRNMAADDPDYEDDSYGEGGNTNATVDPLAMCESSDVLLESDHALAMELHASFNASGRVPVSNRIRLKVGQQGVSEQVSKPEAGGRASRPSRPSRAESRAESRDDRDGRDGVDQGDVGNELGEDEYMNTDDEEEAQRRAEEAKKLKNTPACMLPDEVLDGMGEEVEMVIAHRVEGGVEGEYSKVPLSGKGAWKHWVFYVKWARYSHVHNTWEGYETLRGFGGFKKVMNYCKRVDEMQARKMEMTAEEREEVDWRENMEEEVWSLFLVRSMVACEASDAASASLAEALT